MCGRLVKIYLYSIWYRQSWKNSRKQLCHAFIIPTCTIRFRLNVGLKWAPMSVWSNQPKLLLVIWKCHHFPGKFPLACCRFESPLVIVTTMNWTWTPESKWTFFGQMICPTIPFFHAVRRSLWSRIQITYNLGLPRADGRTPKRCSPLRDMQFISGKCLYTCGWIPTGFTCWIHQQVC